MSKQDKATTAKFTKTLRELVKRPENKVCADCKRNDPRWASWNLGVFLCIRCSGIHRGMGTHISKVKSVDLDVWTPEQMESIQKWGNHLANLYWEAHLKVGHHPPEHKMESFIRSKYESKRWAMEGPPPEDLSSLDGAGFPATSATQPSSSSEQAAPSLSNSTTTRSTRTTTPISMVGPRQQQPHQLLSANFANRLTPPGTSQPAFLPPHETAPAFKAQAPDNDLFSLDFKAPPASTSVPEPKKDVKQDILSLFSSDPVAAASPIQTAPTTMQNYSLNWQGNVPQQQAEISMIGTTGTGMWGASSGWSGSVPVIPAQPNIWNTPATTTQSQSNIFDTNSIWGGTSTTKTTTTTWEPTNAVQKKDEVFGDIWGGFK